MYFAFSEVSTEAVIRVAIGLIGLGGSIVLWFHIYASNKDGKELNNKLKTRYPELYEDFHDLKTWRHSSRFARCFYYPAADSAGYFIEFVGIGWILTILFSTRSSLEDITHIPRFLLDPLAMVVYAGVTIGIFAVLSTCRKFQQIRIEEKGNSVLSARLSSGELEQLDKVRKKRNREEVIKEAIMKFVDEKLKESKREQRVRYKRPQIRLEMREVVESSVNHRR